MITNQITSLLVVELTTEPNPNKFLESKIFSVGVLSNYYGAQNKPGLALLSFNTIIPHGPRCAQWGKITPDVAFLSFGKTLFPLKVS